MDEENKYTLSFAFSLSTVIFFFLPIIIRKLSYAFELFFILSILLGIFSLIFSINCHKSLVKGSSGKGLVLASLIISICFLFFILLLVLIFSVL